MRKTKQRKFEVWHYDELAEFYEINQTPGGFHESNLEHERALAHSGNGSYSADWSGGTREQGQDLRNWPEGIDEFYKIDLQSLNMPEIASIRRLRAWDIDGDDFDQDRFDSQYEDCWRTRKKIRSPKKQLTITIDIGAPCNKKAKDMIWSGLVAVRFADLLEQQGYRTKIDVCCAVTRASYHNNDKNIADILTVKHFNEAIEIESLLITCAHPLFFRWLIFNSWLHRPFLMSDGLGFCTGIPDYLQGDIHIPKVYSRDDALIQIESIVKNLTKLGITK